MKMLSKMKNEIKEKLLDQLQARIIGDLQRFNGKPLDQMMKEHKEIMQQKGTNRSATIAKGRKVVMKNKGGGAGEYAETSDESD